MAQHRDLNADGTSLCTHAALESKQATGLPIEQAYAWASPYLAKAVNDANSTVCDLLRCETRIDESIIDAESTAFL